MSTANQEDYLCPVCKAKADLFDVVDFNKSCMESAGQYLPLSGFPVYYVQCTDCGFMFAPELHQWANEQFAEHIYNADYIKVDPDYVQVRPVGNAEFIDKLFGQAKAQISHLDYGSGSGLMSQLLNQQGWRSLSYDPFNGDKIQPVSQLGAFNLITAFEVFEHVADIAELMRNLKALMANESVVIFSTLTSDGCILKGKRLDWWYASPRNGHISLYTVRSLRCLADAYGLNFGSFNSGSHVFVNTIPDWSKHVLS